MGGILLQNGKQAFTDANSRPLVGGKVYFFKPGTQTPIDTWQDAALTVLNTNPIILDARGEASIYGTGAYRQVLRDSSGVLIWDQFLPDLLEVLDDAINNFFLSNLTIVPTVDALRLLDSTTRKNAFTQGYSAAGDGGHGIFMWRDGNYSTQVTSDPKSGLYVAPATDLTGVSGAWVRIRNQYRPVPEWWGRSAVPAGVNSTILPVSVLKNRAGATQDQWIHLYGDSHGWGQGSPESQIYTTAGNVSVHSSNLHNKGFMQRLSEDIASRRGFDTCVYGAWTSNYPATGIRQGFYDHDAQDRADNDPIKIKPIIPIAGKILGGLVPLTSIGSFTNQNFYSPAATSKSYVQLWRDKLARGVFGLPMLTMALETVDDFREAGKTDYFQISINPAKVASGAGFTTFTNQTGGVFAEISTAGDVYISTMHTPANLPSWVGVGASMVMPGYGLVLILAVTATSGGTTIRIGTAAGAILGSTAMRAVRDGMRFYHPMYLQKATARISMRTPARAFYVAVRHKPGAGTLSFYFTDNLGSAGAGNTPYATSAVARVNSNDFEWFAGAMSAPTVAGPGGVLSVTSKATMGATNFAIDCSPITTGVTEEVIYRMDFGSAQTGDLYIESTGTCDFRGVIFDNNKVVNLSMGGHTVGGWIGTDPSFSDAATDHVAQILSHTPVQPSHVISQIPFVNEYLRQTPIATFKANLQTFIDRFKNHMPGSNNFNAKGVDFLFFTSLRQRSVGWEGAASAPITFDMYVQAAKEFCAASGCAFIDVEAALSTEIRSGKIDYQRLYNDDSHPSDYANELIYRELQKTIMAIV